MVSGIAFSVAPRNNGGCGLGTILFEGKDGLLQQVLAATTNGFPGTQTFGISSGTLDCNKSSKFASNMDNPAKDAAMGHGEYVDTLAELMDVHSLKRVEFSQMLQANFSNIFTDGSVSNVDVIENIPHLI